MTPETIKAMRYIESLLTILAECYQHDNGRNEWFGGWAEWSQEWLTYVDGDMVAYGQKAYETSSHCHIVPLHVVPHKPVADRVDVDWAKVGQVIRSHFGT